MHNKKKVKWSRYRPGVAQRVGRGSALLFHDRGTRRRWVVSSTPGHTLPPGKMRYPFYRRLGGPQGQSGRVENLVPTRIRSLTIQPVVSHYTDWATQPIVPCTICMKKSPSLWTKSANETTFCSVRSLFFSTDNFSASASFSERVRFEVASVT